MTASVHIAQLLKHCTEAASTIHAECAEALATKEDHGQVTAIAGCGPALVDLLSRQASITHGLYGDTAGNATTAPTAVGDRESGSLRRYDLALKRLEDIASIAYSKFYAYLFKDLPACWRQLYTDARILKFCLLFLKSPYAATYGLDGVSSNGTLAGGHAHGSLDELVKTLDLALILAGAAGERRGRGWIDRALDLLRCIWLAERQGRDINRDFIASGDRPAKRAKLTGGHGSSNISSTSITDYTFSNYEPFAPPVMHPIRKVEAPSIEEFQTYMDHPPDLKLGPEPLIICNALREWPALSTRPWNQPSYLLSQTLDGRRLVPVEVGRSYVDEGWGQRLITFGEFLREHIDGNSRSDNDDRNESSKTLVSKEQEHGREEEEEEEDNTSPQKQKPKTAYLAQHQLFVQLPGLRGDILVPDYCYTSPPPHPTDPRIDQPELDEPLLNAWFGPPGTISPLHHDPYHNVLAQVVGRKYVRLYAPRETARLAARGRENGVEMGNTSRLDVGVLEGWDRRPEEDHDDNGDEVEEGRGTGSRDRDAFAAIPFVDCILGPGDALYIPIGWWHYVRGLSVSFSVSFWWN
ncbi:hypothetical protein SAMD00023353_1800680 [Rosellinia necatrix]|uniref:JmjC domain-containing protein n=1 Tax=Rosellinia necatrix TaxID=77044 RepID=A0A1W2TEA4_ROSNE|nr:hypothetical protein SAMD00023353_1800680 [Rosellinia necatrix]